LTAVAGEPTRMVIEVFATDGMTAEGVVAALGCTVVTPDDLRDEDA
jgi:hypothetical protein